MLKRLLILPALLLAACAPQATGAPSAPQVAAPATAAPASTGWPRTIDTLDGPVRLGAPPQHIVALSLGYEEITLALLPPSRMAAVSTFAVNPTYSNVVDKATQVPNQIGREPEAVIATNPDIVIAGQTTKKELVASLRAVGLPVLVSPMPDTVGTLAENIAWLGQIYGADEAAKELNAEVDRRLARIDEVVSTKPQSERPTAVLVSLQNYVAGKGGSRDYLLNRAGAINAAAVAGVDGAKQVSDEALVAMNPDVIIIDEDPGKGVLFNQVKNDPALADIKAIRNGRIYPVKQSYLATLSHAQVRGVEEVAKVLWPKDFAGVTFEDFK